MMRWILVAAAILTVSPASAQDLGGFVFQDGTLGLKSIQLFALLTVVSLAPGIAMMVTCFPFIVTVLSLLRQAIGLQQSPPNMLIVSLAMFLTWFVMEPVAIKAWNDGIAPIIEGQTSVEAGLPLAIAPLRAFMEGRTEPETLAAMAELRPQTVGEVPLSVLVPSFMLSEISRAFQMGFVILLPFLIIDLVVSAVLMSIGMMMVPPAIVSLPFKLAFFVVADGWTLIAQALVRGYAT